MPEQDGDRTSELLRSELLRVQLEALRMSMDNRIVQNASDIADHEKRLRLVEDTSTKFNFLLYLVMGGGLISLINLGLLAFTLLSNMRP